MTLENTYRPKPFRTSYLYEHKKRTKKAQEIINSIIIFKEGKLMLRYLPVRKVHARQVLDSRGNPTVEAEVTVKALGMPGRKP